MSGSKKERRDAVEEQISNLMKLLADEEPMARKAFPKNDLINSDFLAVERQNLPLP